ncbi:hypothetical protein Mapa_007687 [Marchantia paleacea]|nr:hypothetical protein Mapa_007687 [Marchantia paleacea]
MYPPIGGVREAGILLLGKGVRSGTIAASLRCGGRAARASFFSCNLIDSPLALSLSSFNMARLCSFASLLPSSAVSNMGVSAVAVSISASPWSLSSTGFALASFFAAFLAAFTLAFSCSISRSLSLVITPSSSISAKRILSFSFNALTGEGAFKQASIRSLNRSR